MKSNQSDYRKYLDPKIVSKLKSLELKARLVVEGFMIGLHKSPYHGFSAEFSEHRPYNQGDSLKDIDWKVFGKQEKYFIKRYEEETNLISHVILDISKSMDYKHSNEITKLEYGKILASSLIYIMLQQQDSCGLVFYSDEINQYYQPKSNRVYLKTLLRAIETIVPIGKTETANALNKIADKIKKRGLIIIISDFFDNLDSIFSSLKHFNFKKNEVIVFQILDPIEKSFAFGKDAIFVDKETTEEITTQPYQLQKSYQLAMQEFLSKLKKECLSFGMEYNLIDTTQLFEKALFSYFKKRHKLH
ncbi:MAG: DUF58 domain-containing protein [Ignavibacteriales bacterium]|nr:DUF58 domain-containing protein [Ignavibacteriales bacterium]